MIHLSSAIAFFSSVFLIILGAGLAHRVYWGVKPLPSVSILEGQLSDALRAFYRRIFFSILQTLLYVVILFSGISWFF